MLTEIQLTMEYRKPGNQFTDGGRAANRYNTNYFTGL